MEAKQTSPSVDRLVHENERLVNYMGNRYLQRYHVGTMEREDLISWGFLGLVKAARVWSPDRGVAFSSLACKIIERAIIRGVQQEWKPDQAQVTVSLDAQTLDDEGGAPLSDFLPAVEHGDVETRLTVRDAVARLSASDRELIRHRYYEGRSLTEVGRAMGLSSMGVLARERNILRRLRLTLAPAGEDMAGR
jgi:RNA polymerase sigma factor (sigma-70 family)